MGRLSFQIYKMPLSLAIIWMILMFIVWAIFAGHAEDKDREMLWIRLNRILLVLYIVAILILTLLNREAGSRAGGSLFGKLRALSTQKEYIREMLMNILLFVPFGLFMGFGARKPGRGGKTGRQILKVVLSGMVFSAIIEFLQYVFSLGVPEIEDIICNSIGALIGTGAFVLWMKSREIRNLFLNP